MCHFQLQTRHSNGRSHRRASVGTPHLLFFRGASFVQNVLHVISCYKRREEKWKRGSATWSLKRGESKISTGRREKRRQKKDSKVKNELESWKKRRENSLKVDKYDLFLCILYFFLHVKFLPCNIFIFFYQIEFCLKLRGWFFFLFC